MWQAVDTPESPPLGAGLLDLRERHAEIHLSLKTSLQKSQEERIKVLPKETDFYMLSELYECYVCESY